MLKFKKSEPIYTRRPTVFTEKHFWDCMNALRWPDRSDSTVDLEITKKHLAAHVSKTHKAEFKRLLLEFCDALSQRFSDKPWFQSADTQTQLGLVAHVICKGQMAYLMALEDPDFCEYLLQEYQNFWPCVS